MRFRKISYNPKNGEVSLDWKTNSENSDGQDVFSLKTKDQPTEDFVAALESLAPFVIDICQLPDDYQEDMVIKSVTISYNKNDLRGVTITAAKVVERSNSPFMIHTPIVKEGADGNSNEESAMPLSLLEGIDYLCQEAKEFVNGKRSQEQLFDEEEEQYEEEDVTA